MIYSIIKKSQLEGAMRLDAEYYQPEYLEIALKLGDAPTINTITSDIRYGLYVEPDYKEEGVNFVRAMNTTNFWIDGEILKIPGKLVPKEYYLNTGDCLIVRSGANTGMVSIVYPRLENSTFGSYTIRLRFNKINPFFAAVFLNTKYGISQTQRSQTGAAQPNLNIPNIKEIRIPIVNDKYQKEIESLVLLIEKTKQESEDLYSQAETLLLEELGLNDFKNEEKVWNIVNFRDIFEARRMDAEYFGSKHELLENKLKKYKSKNLSDVVENVSAKFNPDPDKNYKYVELSNINSSVGIIDGSSDILGKEAPNRARRVLKENDVIVSSIEGSLEKVALVDKYQNEYLASTGFFQWKSKEILPQVLLILSRSFVIQDQLRKRCAGAILTAVPKESIRDILIPVLPKEKQEKIADLVKKSHKTRKEAIELLEMAKKKVEEMIEKS